MRRPRATYANVVASVALLLSLGGTAVAATMITGADIKDRSVPGVKLEKNTVTGTEAAESTFGVVPGAKTVNGASVQHVAKRLPEGSQATAKWVDLATLPGLGTLAARCLADLGGTDNAVVRVTNTTSHDLWLRSAVVWPGSSAPSYDRLVLGSSQRSTIDVDASQGSDAIAGFDFGLTDGAGAASADVDGTAVNRPHDDSACVVELTAVSK